MSVNSKMTAIADKIRALLGTSSDLSLDAMATNLGTVQTNVSNAFTVIRNKGGTVPSSQVSGNLASAIESIPSGTTTSTTVGSATKTLSSRSTSISFTGLTGSPSAFYICPTGNITYSTSYRYVSCVSYDGSITKGVYVVSSGSSSNRTYTGTYSTSYFTWTYSNGTLTVKSSSSTNGGYFANNVAYQLIYVV